MIMTKLHEAGRDAALLGLSLSYQMPINRMEAVADRLCDRDGGHNKYLESIVTWWDITAARYWWSQMDTYRHKTQQSESTMHTILNRHLTQDDFAMHIDDDLLSLYNGFIDEGDLASIKALLPEAFLQRRVVCVNYKSLRNIIYQRRAHRLMEWRMFCDEVLRQVNDPKWLAIE